MAAPPAADRRKRPPHRGERERQAWRASHRGADRARAPRRERPAHAEHQEIEGWLRTIKEPRCILSAGGDGSAVALLNALDRVVPERASPSPRSARCRSAPATHGRMRSAPASSTSASASSRVMTARCPRSATASSPATERSRSSPAADGTPRCSTTTASSSRPRPTPSRRACGGYLSAMLFRTAPKNILYGPPARDHREPRRRRLLDDPREEARPPDRCVCAARSSTRAWRAWRARPRAPSSATGSARIRMRAAARVHERPRLRSQGERRDPGHPEAVEGPASAARHDRTGLPPRCA